ncbi:MAG TPA: DUF397 domain-containing protein [Pseudonocardiaceae bacterium]|jgi:hypothetical protein|nr:DUF397 domain-containing protein [Pseudonocardiaceae bacterium]
MSTSVVRDARWRKSTRSNGGGGAQCVELAHRIAGGAVRDSKNPAGPVLHADLSRLLAAIKTGRFDS